MGHNVHLHKRLCLLWDNTIGKNVPSPRANTSSSVLTRVFSYFILVAGFSISTPTMLKKESTKSGRALSDPEDRK